MADGFLSPGWKARQQLLAGMRDRSGRSRKEGFRGRHIIIEGVDSGMMKEEKRGSSTVSSNS